MQVWWVCMALGFLYWVQVWGSVQVWQVGMALHGPIWSWVPL
jgi:hypothetical protein